MMPYTCKVIIGAGLWLTLGLTGDFADADDWYREHGLASYYGKGFHGRKAADGDRFSQNEMTAAHRQSPLGHKSHGRKPRHRGTSRGQDHGPGAVC